MPYPCRTNMAGVMADMESFCQFNPIIHELIAIFFHQGPLLSPTLSTLTVEQRFFFSHVPDVQEEGVTR